MTRQRDPGQWWDEMWSPVTGCTPAGDGCRICWARSMVRRFETLHMRLDPVDECYRVVEDFSTVVCHPDRLDKPLHWRKPRVVLVSGLGDLFHEHVPAPFIRDAFAVMRSTPQHHYQVLTKRPKRAAEFIADQPAASAMSPHIMPMASVWDHASALRASLSIAHCGVPFGFHVEPMLGPIDMTACAGWPGDHGAHPWCAWVVCGGENGPGARPMDPAWALDLREQCRAAGVPFWWKGASRIIFRGLGASTREADALADLEQTREVPW